ncbi:bactofilin family protein [Ottowia thiooxydans]|uniref:Cytoskeletal protein CcmA (Bactofilin family) n=1 Tax=Ottowia thiooxydans TaxID=219182 RepID=A0ABV2Q925_9BURK
MLGIKKQASTRSTIGPGMRVVGDCTFQDGLQIDGEVIGNVTADPGPSNTLVISETGRVQGAVLADHVVISGSVTGPVHARELLELQSKARVEGDVRYKTLEMQQGAVIAGQLQPQVTKPMPVVVERQEPLQEPTEPTLDFDKQ